MKKYNSIIYIVSLACAGLIFTGCATNQAHRANTCEFRSFTRLPGRKFREPISVLSCPLMGRMWEALPRAETTVATCRQASTRLPPGLIPIRAGSARDKRP